MHQKLIFTLDTSEQYSLILPCNFLPTLMVNWPAKWWILSGSSIYLKILWSLRTQVKAYLLN